VFPWKIIGKGLHFAAFFYILLGVEIKLRRGFTEMTKKKILIADDEQDAVEFVKTVAEEAGDFEIFEANDGNQAVELAKKEHPDLIILDVHMPKKDGFNAFCDIRKVPELQDTPVVMLTGVAAEFGFSFSKEDMGNFLGSEPIEFLDKPVNPIRLQQVIEEVLSAEASS